MKLQTIPWIRRVCVITGIGLLIAAGAMMLRIHNARNQAQEYVHILRTLMPEPQSAVMEEWGNQAMPALSLEGTDFIGILEIPQYGSALPVSGEWGRSYLYPCRLSGSVYDGSIQIGGTSQQGQFDFYRQLSVGDRVFFTDVAGNRYAYTVTHLRYETHADQEALQRRAGDLTLFIKNIYAFEYILVFCEALG